MGKLMARPTDEHDFIDLILMHVPNLLFEQYTPEAICDEAVITRDKTGEIRQFVFRDYAYTYAVAYGYMIETYGDESTKYREQLPLREYNKLRTPLARNR